MKNKSKFNYLLLLFLLIGVGCNKVNTSSENHSSLSSEEKTSSSSIIKNKEEYGELIIPDMTLYTKFPDVPLPTFTNEQYKSEITYKVLNEDIVEYKKEAMNAKKAGVATVEASTKYHTTTFTITCHEYVDTNKFVTKVGNVERSWIRAGKPQVETLFIGDSFFDTQFWSDFYLLFDDNTIFTHGISATTTTDWEIFSPRLVYPAKPKNLVMHLGTNNLYDDNETAEVTFENTKRLIETIHSRLPETKIYYFAIEPRVNAIGENLPFDQSSFDKISYVNDNMETFSSENNYMVYLDITSNCYEEGIKVNESFFRDGVHPKLSNYQFYLDALKEVGLELKVNENAVNTLNFDIEFSPSILNTNVVIKKEREYLVNNYSVKGKFKVTKTGTNSHIQFSLDDTSYRNRFLLWDSDNNGSLLPSYALDGKHVKNQGDANVVKDVEFSFEVVTTTKHSYFYINGSLEIVFLNVYAEEFMIGAEYTSVSFYDIECTLQSDEGWQNILSREELVTYENSSELTTKAVVI